MNIYFDPKCSVCGIYAPDIYEKCLAKTAEECPAFGNCHICEITTAGFVNCVSLKNRGEENDKL